MRIPLGVRLDGCAGALPHALGLIGREDPSIRTRIWWNFWEAVIKSPESLVEHINYVHENPRYHGLVSDPATYQFTSLPAYLAAENSPIVDWQKSYSKPPADLIDSF